MSPLVYGAYLVDDAHRRPSAASAAKGFGRISPLLCASSESLFFQMASSIANFRANSRPFARKIFTPFAQHDRRISSSPSRPPPHGDTWQETYRVRFVVSPRRAVRV